MTRSIPYLIHEEMLMSRYSWSFAAVALILATGFLIRRPPDPGKLIPEAPAATSPVPDGPQIAVFAGGCFWGVEAVFERVLGVTEVVSGYAGGTARNAEYETVSTGRTGHAESVRITYDPTEVSYGKLLEIFFSVAHDPTQLNRQGPDVGTQYRSAIFYTTPEQATTARAYIAKLDDSGAFDRPIVTQLQPLDEFYTAEAYHQDYYEHHPTNPYIVINDRPKVEALKQRFGDVYRAR
jgi:peptide-methionine (S)-S-oxide reductase